MRAMDVMTTEVFSVGPDASVQALAALLSKGGTNRGLTPLSRNPICLGPERIRCYSIVRAVQIR